MKKLQGVLLRKHEEKVKWVTTTIILRESYLKNAIIINDSSHLFYPFITMISPHTTEARVGFLSFIAHEVRILFSSTAFLLLFIVTLHFSFWLPLLLQPMETEVDAYSRYVSATYDIKYHDFFPLKGSVWLPFYSTILAPTISAFPDSTLAPRLQIALFSSFIPIFLFLITRDLTKQKHLAFATAVLYACLPLFTEISATTLTESLFLSFFTASLYCFLTQRWKLWLMLMMASQALRFEAWFVMPLFMYAITQHTEMKNKTKVVLLALVCIFPAVYSLGGFLTSGDAISYYSEMAAMTKMTSVSGMWNWPEAISSWLILIPKVLPVTFLLLVTAGSYQFIKLHKLDMQISKQQEFILLLLVLPAFLFLMLPIQAFLNLRDWLPVRYILIPITLAFPLIGLGMQKITHEFPFKIYAPLYGLLMVIMVFELWSLKINTHRLLSTYSAEDFKYLQNEIAFLRTKVTIDSDLRINIIDPYETKEYPQLRSSFLIWFFMPLHPTIVETTSEKFKPLMNEPQTEEIIIIDKGQKLPSGYAFEPITLDRNRYQYFKVVKSTKNTSELKTKQLEW